MLKDSLSLKDNPLRAKGALWEKSFQASFIWIKSSKYWMKYSPWFWSKYDQARNGLKTTMIGWFTTIE